MVKGTNIHLIRVDKGMKAAAFVLELILALLLVIICSPLLVPLYLFGWAVEKVEVRLK